MNAAEPRSGCARWRRWILRVSLAALAASLAPAAAGAPGAAPAAAAAGGGLIQGGNERVSVGVGLWHTSGDSRWDISFGEAFEGWYEVSGRSRLEWEDLDADLLVLALEVRPRPWLGIGGRYGSGDVSGRNTDSDWITAPELGLDDALISKTRADTHGKTTLYALDLSWRLSAMAWFPRTPAMLDVVAGYQVHEEDLGDRNGRELDGTPFAGLDSSYDFEWTAYRIGLRGIVPAGRFVRIKAQALALVDVDFRGEGFWNLRTDFKRTPPNFIQKAGGGSGYDLDLALEFPVGRAAAVEIGYRVTDLHAGGGTDTTYFSDGTSGTTDLDNVDSTRAGVYAAVSARF